MTSQLTKHSGPIQGQVAGVLTERELAINIGSSDGVRIGMRFKVLADSPTEIRDPETNEVLGVVDREKVRVEATEVHEKFAICETYETRIVGGALSSVSGWSELLAPARTVTKTLRAEDSAFLPPIPEEESFIKRGDRVVQLRESDSG